MYVMENRELGGDFNLILNAEEELVGKYHDDSSRETIETIIETSNLMGMTPSNGKYTWSNKRIDKNNIKERLEKILNWDTITTTFNNIKYKIIHNIASDHKLIMLSPGTMGNIGPTLFRYNSIWNDSEEVKNITAYLWENQIIGSPSYV